MEHALFGMAQGLTDLATFISGGPTLVFKVVAGSGFSERGSAAGGGDVFPIVVTGV